jgi:hypothetical protein
MTTTVTTSKPTEVDGDFSDRNGAMKIAVASLLPRRTYGASPDLEVRSDVVDWFETTVELTSEVGRSRQLGSRERNDPSW